MSLLPFPGDSLASLAAKHLGSSLSWRKIADINGINPMEDLNLSKAIEIPSRVSAALEQAQTFVGNNSKLLPDRLEGYAKEAIAQAGKFNGSVKDAVQILTKELGDERNQSYIRYGVQVVDWLLK